jgi:hypothetical protein
MLYDPSRDRTVIGTNVIAERKTGDSLKSDRPEGTETCDQKRLNCHWRLNDGGALEMIWSAS